MLLLFALVFMVYNFYYFGKNFSLSSELQDECLLRFEQICWPLVHEWCFDVDLASRNQGKIPMQRGSDLLFSLLFFS